MFAEFLHAGVMRLIGARQLQWEVERTEQREDETGTRPAPQRPLVCPTRQAAPKEETAAVGPSSLCAPAVKPAGCLTGCVDRVSSEGADAEVTTV